MKLNFFKIKPNAKIPEYATKGSAAFDVSICIDETSKIRATNPANREMFFPTRTTNGKLSISILPNFRMLLPTGLKVDIQDGYELDLAIRSSMAYKFGITLSNQLAVIDSDYTDELFIMVTNISDTPIQLFDGDRVAQGLVRKVVQVDIAETTDELLPKGDRVGGIGSTGVSEIKRGPGRPPKQPKE